MTIEVTKEWSYPYALYSAYDPEFADEPCAYGCSEEDARECFQEYLYRKGLI